MVSVAVKRLPHNGDLPLPAYETAAAAGHGFASGRRTGPDPRARRTGVGTNRV